MAQLEKMQKIIISKSLTGDHQIENCRPEELENVEGKEEVARQGDQARTDRHHRLHPLLASLLDHPARAYLHTTRPQPGCKS